MNKLFVFQLLTSFVAGGAVITMLSFLAEKTHKHFSGIIIAFPTTIALGFFFLGWTLSPDTVAEIVPDTLIPLGLTVLFTAVYAYTAEFTAKHTNNKIWQIIISFAVSIGFWFVLAVPVVLLEINNVFIGAAGYFLFTFITHILLHRRDYEKPVKIEYTNLEKISRAIYVGLIIFLAVFLGKTLNPFWGGLFTMFPAAFSSLLMVIHWNYDSKSLFPNLQKAAVGSFSIFAYAITAMLVFPETGFIAGTIISYAVSLVVTLIMMKFQHMNFSDL